MRWTQQETVRHHLDRVSLASALSVSQYEGEATKSSIQKGTSQMIKLILTDMDGTFLNSSGDFNRIFFQEIQTLLKQHDIQFAPVSGKQCERIEELFLEDADGMWILGDSATRIKRAGTYVYESLLPNKIGRQIIRQLEKLELGHTIIACTRAAAVVSETISDEEWAIVRGSYRQVERVADLTAIEDDFVKITVHDPKLRCFETVKSLEPFRDSAYFVASEAAWIDIANHGVHKGTTVEQLQRMLQVRPDETMAFGDGYNDLELFERADFSYAVSNAVPELKARAHAVIGSNDADSVLQTIQRTIEEQAEIKTT